MHRPGYIKALALGLLLSATSAFGEAVTSGMVPASTDQISSQLKLMITEAVSKIPDLQPWQKKIIEEEVIPQYQRFIRDYRQTGNKISGVVDAEILQNYLRFYAPKSLKFQNKSVLSIVRADSSCTKCTESTEGVRDLLKNRLARRGLVPVWLGEDESAVAGMKGKSLNDRVTELSKTKGLAGALVVQLVQVVSEDIDDAHADEKNYSVQSHLFLRDMEKQEGRLDLLENDRFETATGRLLTDTFTSIGVKLATASAARMVSRKEVLLEISGFADHQQYQRILGLLPTYLKNVGSIDERKISKGRIGLALQTDQSPDEIRKQVALAAQDPVIGPNVKMEVP